MKIKITPKQGRIVDEMLALVESYGDEWKEGNEEVFAALGQVSWKKGELFVPDASFKIVVFETRFSRHIEEVSMAQLMADEIEGIADREGWHPASYSPLVKKLKGTWVGPKKKPSTYGDRKKEAEKIVRETVAAGMRVKIDLPVRTKTPEIKMSWHRGRTNCWGGSQYISLAMAKFVPQIGKEKEVYKMTEYSHIKNSPAIGEFDADDWRLPLIAVTCHELAHSLQRQQSKVLHNSTQIYNRAHGDGWRMIYRELREELVNTFLHC